MTGTLLANRYRQFCLSVWRVLLAGLFVITTASADNASRAQARLPTVDLLIEGKVLSAEVAATAQQRYMGLSFREELGPDEGMLFVFENQRPVTFTMRNTLIPLSIAFISKDLTINEIVQMNVGPGQYFPSEKPAKFALEVNQGWFRQNGIKPGDQIRMQP